MKKKVNEFVDLFSEFHSMRQTEQIVLLSYFHVVEEGREAVNASELEHLFSLANTPVPKNLKQLLAYLAGGGKKLFGSEGEFKIRREVIKEIEARVRKIKGISAPPQLEGGSPFDFGARIFNERKIEVLLTELKACYPATCWNACGLLVRIIVERALDAADPLVKTKTGLRDKINACRGLASLSKSLREALDGLHAAKIMGDIAAHHSKIILDKNDVDLVLPAFRLLLKEVSP